ncbi:MAG TPA: glycosyltransferase, partial [Ilumatobacteraceae bacterium]
CGDASIGEWARAVGVAQRLIGDGTEQVVLLWVGAVAVLAPLDALIAVSAEPMTLVPRALSPFPADGLAPSEHDLSEAGLYSTTITVFHSAARPALEWLAANLVGTDGVGRVLERAAQLFGCAVCADATIGAGKWRWTEGEPALLDVDGYDTARPWSLEPDAPEPLRVEVLDHPQRRAALERAAPQVSGARQPLRLPGGIEVDERVRRIVAASAREVPSPWTAPGRFREWLGDRYWRVLHGERRDLLTAFPDPDGRSAIDFHRWCRAAFTVDEVPMLLPAPRLDRQPVTVAERLRDDGLNIVGYFTRHSGLGDVARRLAEAATAVQLPHGTIASQRTDSPVRDGSRADNEVRFTHSLCVVTADQFPYLAADLPELFARTRRMIGYWFWELDYVPLQMRQAIAFVDEIWAGSRFVTDAFAAVTAVPVRHVPIPVVEPQPTKRRRSEFARLAGVGERPLFLCTLDHLSVTERKNPVGVIEAFRRAFAPDEGPVLVVKTMNGRLRWPQHQRVLAAAEGRSDIVVWDEALDRADQMALVVAADCMVSLHRSEGLGLHLAEAMWLATPVIATRYSGNLDFMNDENSLLVDAELVNVENGERVYPPRAKWAAPDLDQAAAAMQKIVTDSELASQLAKAGRQTMERQPTLAETGKLIRRLVLGEG